MELHLPARGSKRVRSAWWRLKKSRVLRIQMEKLMQVCPNGCPAHQQMIRNLVYLLARKNVALNEKIKHISRRTTREKLLAYLADQAKKAGKKDFSIPFTGRSWQITCAWTAALCRRSLGN